MAIFQNTTARRVRWLWMGVAVLLLALLYASTIQIGINGSGHPYTTDTGEFQNALPRWGLLHPSGYPLYAMVGAALVTVMQALGIAPALASSIISLLGGLGLAWVAMLLAQALGVRPSLAALGALTIGVCTSVWMDLSISEIHIYSLLFMLAVLYFALRYQQTGQQRDLLWLALLFSQGVMHQRAVAALAPAVLALIWGRWRAVLAAWYLWLPIGLLAPLVYLYLPARYWAGATWYYGRPGTLDGLLAMQRDNVFQIPTDWQTWAARIQNMSQMLADDFYLPLLALGLAGVLAVVRLSPSRDRWWQAIALNLAWLPFVLLTLIIWEGRVSDAGLAAKMPLLALAGLGVAVTLEALVAYRTRWGVVAAATLAVAVLLWVGQKRPFILSITRDPAAQTLIKTAARIDPQQQPTLLMAPWGNMYWALAYASQYQGAFAGVQVVDHNYDFTTPAATSARLLVLSDVFHSFPLAWWQDRLAQQRLRLGMAAPGVVEIYRTPWQASEGIVPATALNDDLAIRMAETNWLTLTKLQVSVTWQAQRTMQQPYSIAVHLLDDPTRQNVLAQADSVHPVAGWYPTTTWQAGETVSDRYVLNVPAGAQAHAVRIAAYYPDGQGGFVNSAWYVLPVAAP